MTHVTCRLTAKNRDQLRNPTLGNRVRATFLRIERPIIAIVYSIADQTFTPQWINRFGAIARRTQRIREKRTDRQTLGYIPRRVQESTAGYVPPYIYPRKILPRHT